MCGFFGSVGSSLDPASQARILQHLRSRGPTSDGSASLTFRDCVLTLLHSRLAIQDLTNYSNQPFSANQFGLSIVYNGEIYNFRQLREQYFNKKIFKSDGDGEVLLHLYEKFGINFINKVKGMFAIFIGYETRDNPHLSHFLHFYCLWSERNYKSS